MLAQLGETPATSPAMRRGIDYLLRDQEPEGSWFGRWGFNYIYGTWSVLCALNAAGVAAEIRAGAPRRRLAPGDPERGRRLGRGRPQLRCSITAATAPAPSTASQTAWATLGLMAAGEVDSPAVERGIAYLREHQGAGRVLARGAVHRHRVPARLLPSLPRLPEVLPALGDGAVPQFTRRQHQTVMVGM